MNYSFETSLPARKENLATNKKTQCEEVYSFVERGANNLLQVSELTGILQAIVSARVNDLIEENKVCYLGFTIYKNRKRKKIIIVKTKQNSSSNNLFTL